MKKLVVLLQAFCVATVVVEIALLCVMKSNGVLDKDKLHRAMAVVYEMDHILDREPGTPPPPPPSSAELARGWADKEIDLKLQTEAVDTAMNHFLFAKQDFETQVSRFKSVKATFDGELNRKVEETRKQSMLNVRQALEALQPKRAKQQIMKAVGKHKAQITWMLEQMPEAKSRKILAEFRTDEESNTRLEIFQQMKLNRMLKKATKKKRNAAQQAPKKAGLNK